MYKYFEKHTNFIFRTNVIFLPNCTASHLRKKPTFIITTVTSYLKLGCSAGQKEKNKIETVRT